uniref:WAP domain-containing protein n=1 Tax=Cyprinodon variegatus TaxID=28743 RepID=A0A3Q2FVY9_CYPVA
MVDSITIFFILYSLLLSFLSANPACPNTDGKVGPCVQLCSSDNDCPTGEICCSNGCGHTCIRAEDPKVGKCPLVHQTFLPARPCLNDGHCPGQEKCCRFAGGSASNPACPNTDGKVGACVELCSSDSDCPTGEICCSNGCGHTCIRTGTCWTRRKQKLHKT